MSRLTKPRGPKKPRYQEGDVLYNPASDSLLLVEQSLASLMYFYFNEQRVWRYMAEVPNYLVYVGTIN